MKRFALTQSVGFKHEATDTLNQSYVNWCGRMGWEPVIVPTMINDPAAYVRSLGVEGLLLTGGNDVGGTLAAVPGSACSPERDRLESTLVATALEAGWPILGVCRGLQFLNCFFGGSLLADLNRNLPGAVPHVAQRHLMQLQDDRVKAVVGVEGWTVNSFHRHGVTRDRLASELRAFAFSAADQLVEGVIHPKHRMMAVQWHPERPGSEPKFDDRLFHGFLSGEYWPATHLTL